jgi:hypothetical protein
MSAVRVLSKIRVWQGKEATLEAEVGLKAVTCQTKKPMAGPPVFSDKLMFN